MFLPLGLVARTFSRGSKYVTSTGNVNVASAASCWTRARWGISWGSKHRRSFHASLNLDKNVAVVLSGCGVFDGSEIHEASSVLVHLSRAKAAISIFAPDIPQMHAINHTKGEPYESNRNVLEESARVARGKISPLSDLDASNFDAVIFPGGFGAAKNLSSFAVDGDGLKVEADVEKTIKAFHSLKKPIGLCCISPVLAAKVIPGCEVTVGGDQEEEGKWPYAGTAGAIQALGSKHVPLEVSDIHVDEANRIVTTPAFMCDTAGFHEVFDGVGAMTNKVLSLLD